MEHSSSAAQCLDWRITKLNPDTVKGYQALTAAGHNTNLLGPKTRELISLAVAVTVRCDGCIAVHAEAAARHGASRVAIAEVLGVATTVNAGAALVYSSWTPMSRSPLRHDPPRPLARPHSGRVVKLRAHAEVCIDRTGAGTWARLSNQLPLFRKGSTHTDMQFRPRTQTLEGS
ncbi:carboxymuconolactone decarboxylase family protein [Bradyrhizobium sp. SRL28]|uniref:carboxymuconolactone decarboxylase family protein n=1 Tax=Bradyrhizobium sp. SRL28 TaxID=2836178 RepID=UPI0027DFD01C|nr:carboxymuconolactone decarboxylase family protein [Bradyrhizobium sp. SRL28]